MHNTLRLRHFLNFSNELKSLDFSKLLPNTLLQNPKNDTSFLARYSKFRPSEECYEEHIKSYQPSPFFIYEKCCKISLFMKYPDLFSTNYVIRKERTIFQ